MPYRSQDCYLPIAPNRRLSPRILGLSLRTTTIHVSGLNADPASLIRLASDSRYRVYPQASLPPCWLGFRRVGLELLCSHPLGNNNQFQYLYTSQGFGFISARGMICYVFFSSIHLTIVSSAKPILPIWQWFCACSSLVKIIAVTDFALVNAFTCMLCILNGIR